VRFAINPLQWDVLDPSGVGSTPRRHSLDVLRAVHDAGFRAVTAEPDAFGGARACADALASCGLDPAPGYYSAPLSAGSPTGSERTRARAFAAAHVELGLGDACLADDLDPQRVRQPRAAVGASVRVVERIVEAVLAIAEIWREEGLEPCLHNHVGTGIQTAAEIDAVLDATAAAGIGYCPDTGHLAWAGIDPITNLTRHCDRVRLLHLKDVDIRVAGRSGPGWDYGAAVVAGLWQEPGFGDLDLRRALAAVGGRTAWVIVEVDHSSVDPVQSADRCRRWVASLGETMVG
jgi:inosose dehydratase